MIARLLSWLFPVRHAWRERIDRLDAMEKANPPKVLYEEPDGRVRPKVTSLSEWLKREDTIRRQA